MIARIMFTLMNSIDLLLYMQSIIPFLVHVERLECRKLISIVQECWCLVDLIIARYLESLGRCTSGQSVFHAFISDRMTPKFSLLCFVFFEQAPTIMFYHLAWITIGTNTSLTSRERTLLSILLRGHVFFFFLTASGKYQSNNENNEWFVGWHLSFLYYALFFWASTYHYVLSDSLNHYRNEYFIDVKEKEFSWVFYWGVMFFFNSVG